MIDYDEFITNNGERNYVIAELAKYAHRKGYFTIILVERLRHLRNLSRRLKKIPHKIVAGSYRGVKIDVRTRLKHKNKFESGKIRLIIANKVFKKGIDIKRLDVIIDGAGAGSKDDAIQKFGRGLRRHAEKKGLLYFDIADKDEKPRKVLVKCTKKEREKTGEKYKRVTKYNRFHKASQSRKGAFKKAGIETVEFQWDKEGEAREAFRAAKRALKTQKGKRHGKSKTRT
jgi:superfamily II DNA or RNA helicase